MSFRHSRISCLQVRLCDTCQRTNRKLSIAAPELHPVPVVSPWFHLGIDLIGPISPLSRQGNSYILTISDYFTKFVDAIALPDKEAVGVAAALFKVYIIIPIAFSHAVLSMFRCL